ncbi:TadE/TadG family type IV pilus assembly protein [Nocardioides sp. GCM10027113]|uniref:TadE/TadG family type IV pilus assembly protein n=1 Tax=unclassified Nocardioides TaxID=2615069 RepID=UPI00360C7E7C
MGTSRRARRHGERGASAVEFALIVPLLMMVLFGLITTGLAFSDHLSATNATREGARYGAATSISNSSWATSVRDRVKQTYFNAGVTVTNDQICVRLVRSTGTTAAEHIGASCGSAPPVPANMASGSCAVLVWMQRPQRIRLIAFPDLTFNSKAESVAYYSRKVASTCPVA